MEVTVQQPAGDLDHIDEIVRERVADIRSERRLPDAVLAAIRDTGLNRMTVPTELGGAARPPTEMAAIIERIAAADGSAGWCAAIGSGSNAFAGYVPRTAAAEIWSDVDSANASMFAPTGNVETDGDGLVLRGRWSFVSNCLHSTWIGVGAFTDPGMDVTPPGPRIFFVPANEVTVHDTWDTDGLRGTGSHDVSVDGAAVALSRSCSFADTPWATGPLWRIPLFNVLAPPLAAVLVGIARGALAVIDRMIVEGHASGRGALADDDVALADVAHAHATLDAARAALYGSMDELWAVASADVQIPRALRARNLLAVQHAVDVAEAVVSTAHRVAGSAAAYRNHPLAIATADVGAGRQHILFSHHSRPALAKAMAGCEASAPPFL
jgi:alkylation response protein AidB-like acyl-CoA dehydrogenase